MKIKNCSLCIMLLIAFCASSIFAAHSIEVILENTTDEDLMYQAYIEKYHKALIQVPLYGSKYSATMHMLPAHTKQITKLHENENAVNGYESIAFYRQEDGSLVELHIPSGEYKTIQLVLFENDEGEIAYTLFSKK
jgi:hypothetical protein